eukprot:6185037-Pleurochrysis_carterae.AAC.3
MTFPDFSRRAAAGCTSQTRSGGCDNQMLMQKLVGWQSSMAKMDLFHVCSRVSIVSTHGIGRHAGGCLLSVRVM